MQEKSYSKKSYTDNTLEEESISLLEASYSEGITKLKIDRLPISVEANEDKCVFNEPHSNRFIDSSSKVLSEYDFLE